MMGAGEARVGAQAGFRPDSSGNTNPRVCTVRLFISLGCMRVRAAGQPGLHGKVTWGVLKYGCQVVKEKKKRRRKPLKEKKVL